MAFIPPESPEHVSNLLPYLVFAFLVAGSFTFGTVLQPVADKWKRQDETGGILKVLLGDGRRLFANHFFVKADVSFHGGYYPSIFDQAAAAPRDTRHLMHKDNPGHGVANNAATNSTVRLNSDPLQVGFSRRENLPTPSNSDHSQVGFSRQENLPTPSDSDHSQEAEKAHEKAMAFLGPPRDWIERFGRNFIITEHTHLQGSKEREILPWLRISAELNPNNPDTYTVAAYWLRDLGKTREAEAFLREGVRNNPDSYEIYFEMGRLYFEDHHDTTQARNFWELALKKWNASQSTAQDPDLLALDQIAVHLAHLEELEKNYPRAIELLRLASKATPHPDLLAEQIKELRQKMAAAK